MGVDVHKNHSELHRRFMRYAAKLGDAFLKDSRVSFASLASFAFA